MATIQFNSTTFTTAQVLFQARIGLERNTPVNIYNGHSAVIFIGDSTVATSGATVGSQIPAATSRVVYVSGNDVIHAISASGSAAGAIVITYSG